MKMRNASVHPGSQVPLGNALLAKFYFGGAEQGRSTASGKCAFPSETWERGHGKFRGARAPCRNELRCAYATRNTNVFPAIHLEKGSRRRGTFASTRNACSTRNLSRHISTNSHL